MQGSFLIFGDPPRTGTSRPATLNILRLAALLRTLTVEVGGITWSRVPALADIEAMHLGLQSAMPMAASIRELPDGFYSELPTGEGALVAHSEHLS